MKHIPYENGIHQERPEDPVAEVAEITEEMRRKERETAWEENDIYISGVRGKDHEET